ARDDADKVRYSGFHEIANAEHYVEVLVQYAGSASSLDGLVTLSIDGVQVDQFSSLDIYDADKRPDNVQLGAILGVDAGTLGVFYLDELLLREGADEIGPVID
ncbi:MAG: hypothetical protein JXM73_05150, partial [Anaerolineae bacterium]|nr:hypothetical protein [Anaerolineae bacterium]